ncbi:hypothetical protein A5647_24215 [Mycobacterium sp. 1100029.7]|nr:hypothetical protein A5647_24215 [Mycobacterium sp. 1100029.7]
MTAQTIGNALQLGGSVITLGGLAYAWHITSGRLVRLRDGMRDRLIQLRESMDKWFSLGPPTPASASVTIQVPTAMAFATMYPPRVGTPETRLKDLEGEFDALAKKLSAVTDALRTEIDQARIAVLDESKALSDAIRLKDIWPAIAGLLVSIIGIAWQLFG